MITSDVWHQNAYKGHQYLCSISGFQWKIFIQCVWPRINMAYSYPVRHKITKNIHWEGQIKYPLKFSVKSFIIWGFIWFYLSRTRAVYKSRQHSVDFEACPADGLVSLE